MDKTSNGQIDWGLFLLFFVKRVLWWTGVYFIIGQIIKLKK